MSPRPVAATWAGLYLLMTLLWVSATDAAVAAWMGGTGGDIHWQTIKGAVFAVLSAGVLYLVLLAALTRLAGEERRWLHMMQVLDDVAWVSDARGELQFLNQAVQRIHGRGVAEFMSNHRLWLDVVHPADRAEVRVARKQLASGTGGELHYRILRPDGSVRWLRDRASAIVDQGGRVIGMTGIAEDITEQRQQREAEREQRMRLEAIVSSAMEAIISVDASQTICLFNARAGIIFGVAPQDAIGQPLDRFIPQAHRDRHRALVARYATGASHSRRMGRTGGLTGLRANGEVFPIEASISRSGEGDRMLMTVVLTDATEQMQAERARQAQLAAEAANQAKSRFLANMSHELRTPLNAVLGLAQVLLSDRAERPTDRQQVRLKHIQTAGWHLLALINDVLDLSRIEAGGLQVDAAVVDVVALQNEACTLCESLAETHRVALRPLPQDAEPVWVLGDAVRMRQVLINLLSNAIKYNRPGGDVSLRLSRFGRDVVVEIEDTGQGMSPQQLEHLFEPFNRLGRDGGNVEGSGIGLVLTRQLVERMQGRLEVGSEPGQGTVVRLVLRQAQPRPVLDDQPQPLARSAADAASTPGAAPAPGAQPEGLVLYIEDNPVNVAVVAGLLEQWPGVALEAAPNGQLGLEQARRLQPRLVMLDMRLPDLDGVSVLKALREDPLTARLPVVVLSASAMPDEVALATQAGAIAYWTKPLDFEMLAQALPRLMTSSGAASVPAAGPSAPVWPHAPWAGNGG